MQHSKCTYEKCMFHKHLDYFFVKVRLSAVGTSSLSTDYNARSQVNHLTTKHHFPPPFSVGKSNFIVFYLAMPLCPKNIFSSQNYYSETLPHSLEAIIAPNIQIQNLIKKHYLNFPTNIKQDNT